MPLDFQNSVKTSTSQEVVAFVDSGETTSGDYTGAVIASISDLVSVEGPEDIIAYVNEDLAPTATPEDVTSEEVSRVTVDGDEIVLDPQLSVGGTDTLPDAPQSIDEEGGAFVGVDEFDDSDQYSTEGGLTLDKADGIHLAVQAKGY